MIKLNKKEIEKIFNTKNYKEDIVDNFHNLTLCNFVNELEENELVNFNIEYRESMSDSWLQAEYYNEVISKAIIIDYSVANYYEDFEGLFLQLKYINDELIKINELIIN